MTRSTSTAPRRVIEVRSAADFDAALTNQQKHETAECPTCRGAVHPMVLSSLGCCTGCKFASQRASVA